VTQPIGFPPVRNTDPLNSKFLPVPQSGLGANFRDVFISNRQNIITTAAVSGSQRDNIIGAINQSRITAASPFNAAPAGAIRKEYNIQDHYNVPPEDVKTILTQLQDEIRYSNFSGMSNKGIYEKIENKFIDAFGEDFMMGFNLLQHVYGSIKSDESGREITNYEYIEIGHAFNELVSSNVGYEEMFKVNRERLYGNKSDMEIIDAIIAKHPERLTNRCLALITSEMYSVGITDNIGLGKYVEKLYEKHGDKNMSDWTDYEEVWNSLLNKPANVQELAFPHNTALILEGKNPNVLRVRDILVKLGAELGPNGLFLDPEGQQFVELDVELGSTGDLFDEFLEALNEHDEELQESRDLIEGNQNASESHVLYESGSDSSNNNSISIND